VLKCLSAPCIRATDALLNMRRELQKRRSVQVLTFATTNISTYIEKHQGELMEFVHGRMFLHEAFMIHTQASLFDSCEDMNLGSHKQK